MPFKCLLLIVLLLPCCVASADSLRVAVASNFVATLHKLQPAFKATSGYDLIISSASTGQLYAQLIQGAPFDVFMAADTDRPHLLVNAGLAADLHVYASGKLVLVSNVSVDAGCEAILTEKSLRFLAIANPDLAPYGLAAKQFLQRQNLWQSLKNRMVMGENIAQTTQLVLSGNATAGLLSQALLPGELSAAQCQWPIPTDQYPKINQAMVYIKSSHNKARYEAFLNFMQSPQVAAILKKQGYEVGGG